MTYPVSPIVTHRGLDPSRKDFSWHESTLESFKDHLSRGFGIEFDIQGTKDSNFIVSHESTFGGISGGKDQRNISEVSLFEAAAISTIQGSLGSLTDVLDLLVQYPDAFGALHIKYYAQNEQTLTNLCEILSSYNLAKRLMLFDLAAKSARFLRTSLPGWQLAASVSHPHDIARYNKAVGGTLMKFEDVIIEKDLFDWVWLDEWDRSDGSNREKELYTSELFEKLRAQGFRLAVVSPELHATSPGLLGGESHPDAASLEKLTARLRNIIALRPDLICTDYPDLVQNLLNNSV